MSEELSEKVNAEASRIMIDYLQGKIWRETRVLMFDWDDFFKLGEK